MVSERCAVPISLKFLNRPSLKSLFSCLASEAPNLHISSHSAQQLHQSLFSPSTYTLLSLSHKASLSHLSLLCLSPPPPAWSSYCLIIMYFNHPVPTSYPTLLHFKSQQHTYKTLKHRNKTQAKYLHVENIMV